MKKIITIFLVALIGFAFSFCTKNSNANKENEPKPPLLTVHVDTPVTMAKKLIEDFYAHPNDWVEIDDTTISKNLVRETETWSVYNKKCNFKLDFSSTYLAFASMKNVRLTQPDTLTFNLDEQEQIFEAYGESIYELKLKKEQHKKDSIQVIEDARRKIKEQQLLKNFCK